MRRVQPPLKAWQAMQLGNTSHTHKPVYFYSVYLWGILQSDCDNLDIGNDVESIKPLHEPSSTNNHGGEHQQPQRADEQYTSQGT